MQQEINLYPLLPLPKKSFLTLKMMTVSYSLFLGLLFIIFSCELWGKHKQTVAINTLHQESHKIEQRLTEIKVQYPMLDTTDMQTSVKKLQQDLEAKNNLLGLLSKNRNFSTYLTGFAKAVVQGLWLVNIQVSLDNKSIVLKGYASHPRAITEFMNKLLEQTEFVGAQFQLQEMNKAVIEKENLLSFVISTKVKSVK